MPIDVFISYRGADRVLARKLEQRLRSRWGSRIFRDETSLMAGRAWADQLEHAMSSAKVMLALIGPNWHVRTKGKDWVRDELLGAIEASNPVLPVIIGDPDELASRLTTLPKAFGRQAVVVSKDLAGFDLHKIEKALRDLGAFGDQGTEGLGQQLAEIVPKAGAERALDALAGGRSVVVSGASGSGRSALLRGLVGAVHAETVRAADAAAATPDPQAQVSLVTACGIDSRERNRRTHRVVAAWIDGLCTAIQDLPPDERAQYGPKLVEAVIDFGPDLLAREVLRAALLLPLGDDDSDEQILEASRRPTDQWAPFPPERLVSQSVSVIEQFARSTDLTLTLVADRVESLDGSSKALVTRLIDSSCERVRLVLATSAVHARAGNDSAQLSVAKALDLTVDTVEDFVPISLHDPGIWGDDGAVIQDWLTRHHVDVGDDLIRRFDDPNPYYALSALWYLVDNGSLVEDRSSETTAEHANGSGAPPDVVTWIPAGKEDDLEVPSRDRLLDHKIDEYVPVRFRDVISVGALIGRRFPFSAAYAAASPPTSDSGEPPSQGEIKNWQERADQIWRQLSTVDPDGAVIVCHTTADGERMIDLAQVDLVTHLAQRLGRVRTQRLQAQLAQYFVDPIGADVGDSLDDRYSRAKAAARHWANAGRPRDAADAERVAAGLAEQALAYQEARDHYKRAIRLFTQLLARSKRKETVSLDDHEDLLILANCLYRLGQMTRLANERGSRTGQNPTRYFEQALKRLQELSANLHDRRLAAPQSSDPVAVSPRDLPKPNIIRHHIRLCEALSGWINLELAEWHELQGESQRSRELLFDTLRHAEAARGEADSRWLLAAASARLARQLVDDAIELRSGHPVRSHNLIVEALFQVERVIGLQAVSPDEERNLEDPRSRAWMVLGQILQTMEVEPRLAEWALRRMNEHRRDVSDLVDMMTDRQLGLFLLSRAHRDRVDATTKSEARTLLEGHARWATESGLDREHASAFISLALLELVEQASTPEPDLDAAWSYVDQAIEHSPVDRLSQNARLLRGVLHAVAERGPAGTAYDDPRVVKEFRSALDLPASASDDAVLREGWTTSLVRLLRVCPHLKHELGLTTAHGDRQPTEFFDSLCEDGQLQQTFEQADAYLEALDSEGPLVPSNDRAIWKLLRLRVASECFQHAEAARDLVLELLRTHHDHSDIDVMLPLLERDLQYAVAVHEWYRSTDPSRLLTLARESNMSIDGAEWASPKLLGGRLAIQVLDRQFRASAEIGHERFERISSMVANWASASEDAGPLEQMIFVAFQMSEPFRGTPAWHQLAREPGRLTEAYVAAVAERADQVRQAGLPIVQDLHLVDAEMAATETRSDVRGDDAGQAESPADGGVAAH